MKPSDFYPAAWTDSNVDAAPTQLIADIPITTPEFTQAYWLGWRAWENVPQQYHISRYEDGTFTDVTKPENVPVGFLVSDSGSLAPELQRAALLTNNGTKWNTVINAAYTTQASNNSRLPNSLNVNTILWGSIRLGFLGIATTDTNYEISGFSTIGYNQLLSPGEITVSFSNPIGNATINLSDFVDGGLVEVTLKGAPCKLVLAMYSVTYGRDIRKDGLWYGYQGIRPMMQIHTVDDKPYIEAIASPPIYDGENNFNWGSGKTGNGFYMNFPGTPGTNCPSNNGDIFGGFLGTINFAEVVINIKDIFQYGNFYCRCIERNDIFIVGRVYTFDEIIKTITLLPRFKDTTSTNTYSNTGYLYSKVDLDTNEFMPEFVDGANTDQLTDWQKIGGNINTNEVTDEDIPEYEPEPSGDEDPFGGSNWLTNSFPYGGTDGFVTQYVLTESQLQSFGANLWAKFFTQDFWESICVILPESLSINASDILNYVVSLREYPFDVTAVGNCTNDDPIIFIGRGIVGVTVSGSAIRRMIEYNGHISIESNTIEPYFGDFRDYEPCTRITLFVPFCGVVELTPSQVIGGTITLRYSIDFSTGAIQCTVQVNRGAFTTNLNTLSGSIGANVQMSASNLTQVLQKGAGMVANFSKSASMFAIGMGEVGMAEGAIASAESEQEIANAVGKFQSGVTKAQSAFSIPDLNGVPVPVFGQSGGFASFQITEPMIQRTYHYYELPSNYAHVYGYACNKTVTLSTLENKGFTVCKNVDLSGIPATQDELSAIESLLTSGVYF